MTVLSDEIKNSKTTYKMYVANDYKYIVKNGKMIITLWTLTQDMMLIKFKKDVKKDLNLDLVVYLPSPSKKVVGTEMTYKKYLESKDIEVITDKVKVVRTPVVNWEV